MSDEVRSLGLFACIAMSVVVIISGDSTAAHAYVAAAFVIASLPNRSRP